MHSQLGKAPVKTLILLNVNHFTKKINLRTIKPQIQTSTTLSISFLGFHI